MVKKAENLPELVRKRKGAAVFWYNQGNAAAKVGAETMVDGGGGVQRLNDARKTTQRGMGGNGENDPSVLFIRRSDKMVSTGIEEPKKWIS